MDITQIEIRADKNRALELVTLDEWVALEENKAIAIRDVLSRFVVEKSSGEYLKEDAAKKLLGKMTMKQIMDAGAEFRKALEVNAVPLASGSG